MIAGECERRAPPRASETEGLAMPSLRLAAVGDISLARGVEQHIQENGPRFVFEYARDILARADVRFGNLESVLLGPDFPAGRIRPGALAARDFTAAALDSARFDILNLAANHVLDCGSRGLKDTLDAVARCGAQPVGAGLDATEAHQLAVVERNGLRVGFLAYLEPCNWTLEGGGGRIAYFHADEAVERVRQARRSVDALIVSLHAGMEFRPAPSIPRVGWCRRLAEAGATAVLCHHPHVPQGIERIGGSLIAYSLGNFVFHIGEYQSKGSPHTVDTYVLELEIDNEGVADWRRVPMRIEPDEGRPCLLEGAQAREAQDYFEELDAILHDDARLRELWHEAGRHYLEIYLRRAQGISVEEFLEKHAWRILCNSEASHWGLAVLDMARRRYRQVARGDFEFERPNVPFEE